MRVNDRRYGSSATIDSYGTFDIDFVTMSYDVGFEKPDRWIFDAAKSLSPFAFENDILCLHCGDDMQEDYRGALEAGWQSVLLDRDGKYDSKETTAERVRDLGSLMQKLTGGEPDSVIV